MNVNEKESLEIDSLLEAMYRRWGYDFRNYARASIERRIKLFLFQTESHSITNLIPRVLNDKEFFCRLVRQLSIPVTEMFRDPYVYHAIAEKIFPLLHVWPHFKIWHAGCATGEEVYSLAIFLMEEGLYERATIYATDFNEDAIVQAREGIFGISKIKEASLNYLRAGGKYSLSEYYHANYETILMDASLKKRIVFSVHNLASDTVFGEMHIILCRNVLIYFNRKLQDRVLNIFTESLVHSGFLCLGTKEDLQFTEIGSLYEIVDRKARIYRKEGRL